MAITRMVGNFRPFGRLYDRELWAMGYRGARSPRRAIPRVGIARRWASIGSKRARRRVSPARLASSARTAALHEGAGLRDLRPHRIGVLRERDGSGVMRARLVGVARFLRGRAGAEFGAQTVWLLVQRRLYALAVSPARYAIERGDWNVAATLPVRPSPLAHVEAMTHFARALARSPAFSAALAAPSVAPRRCGSFFSVAS